MQERMRPGVNREIDRNERREEKRREDVRELLRCVCMDKRWGKAVPAECKWKHNPGAGCLQSVALDAFHGSAKKQE